MVSTPSLWPTDRNYTTIPFHVTVAVTASCNRHGTRHPESRVHQATWAELWSVSRQLLIYGDPHNTLFCVRDVLSHMDRIVKSFCLDCEWSARSDTVVDRSKALVDHHVSTGHDIESISYPAGRA